MNAPSASDTADFNDLVRAVVLAQTTTGESREYFSKLRDVLLETLTVALPARRSSEAAGLDILLERAVSLSCHNLDPFAGFFEAPRTVVDLYQKHAEPLQQGARGWQRAIDALIHDAVAARWPGTVNSVVAWAKLIERGVEPRQPEVVSDPWDDF